MSISKRSINPALQKVIPKISTLPTWTITLWLIIIGYSTYAHLWFGHYDANIALTGWSALDFTNWVLFPENFTRDFPGGGWFAGNSLLPHIYPQLKLLVGLDPETTLIIMTALEMLTLTAGAAYLLNSLFKNSRPETSLCLALLLTMSWARLPNLAKFGNPFFHAQFYGFADGIALFAIALYLRDKFYFSALLLAIGFTIHPIKTLFALSFIAAMHLWQWKQIFKLNVLLPYLSLPAFFIIWSIFWIDIFDVSSAISADDFFAYSGLFNAHWFPLQTGVLTEKSARYLIPFLAATLATFTVLLRAELSNERKGQLSFGFIALAVLTIIGLITSSNDLSPAIIKICLQRASILMLSIASIFVVAQTAYDLKQGKWLYSALGISMLASGFFSKDTWPIFIALIYSALPLLSDKTWRIQRSFSLLNSVFIISTACIISWLYSQSFINTTNLFIWGKSLAASLLLTLILIGYNKLFAGHSHHPNTGSRILTFLLLTAFLGFSINWTLVNRTLSKGKVQQGLAYKNVQLWARKSTPADALFIIDPCTKYGWRDYSARSSFGTLQEWLKSGWLYRGDNETLYEGLSRAQKLGIDTINIRHQANSKRIHPGTAFRTLCHTARENFYQPGAQTLLNIAQQYNIQYVIMLNKQAVKYGSIPFWPVVYRNDYYTVLTPPTKRPESE